VRRVPIEEYEKWCKGVDAGRKASFKSVVDELRARRALLVVKAVAAAREGSKLRPDVSEELTEIIAEQGRAAKPWRAEPQWQDGDVLAWALREGNIGDPRAQALALEVRRLSGLIANPVERRKRHTVSGGARP